MALEDVYIGQDHRIPQLRHFPNPVLDVANTSYRALRSKCFQWQRLSYSSAMSLVIYHQSEPLRRFNTGG